MKSAMYRSSASKLMCRLSGNEAALLSLLAMKPLSFLPPLHLGIARKLERRGVVRKDGPVWQPTPEGLALVRRSLQ